jgi:hypothetical protein
VLVWWVFHQQSSQSEVPNLIGIQRAMAEAQLKDVGLNLRGVYEEVSDQSVGLVLRSDPAVGTKLDRGAGVNLVIGAARPATPPSSGPIVIPIPVPGNSAPAPGYPASPPHNIVLPPPNVVLPPNSPAPPPNPAPPPTSNLPTTSPTPPPSPVILGAGRVDHPDSAYHDCATGYRFNFSQQVSMTQPGRVTYRWLRSDGASAPVQYIDFANPGTQTVTTWWQRSGRPGDKLTGWQQIEILTPTSLKGSVLASRVPVPPCRLARAILLLFIDHRGVLVISGSECPARAVGMA